jgi:hypothetical protein
MDEQKPTDLLPEDVLIAQVEDSQVRASLCFLALTGTRKCYTATAPTEKDARQALVDIMKEHLDRAVGA